MPRSLMVAVFSMCACGVELLPTTPGGNSPLSSSGYSNTPSNPGTGGGAGGGTGAQGNTGDPCLTTGDCGADLWCSTTSATCDTCVTGQACENDGVCLALAGQQRTCSHRALGEGCRDSADCLGGLTCSEAACASQPPLCSGAYAVQVTTTTGNFWECTVGAPGQHCNTDLQCVSGFCQTLGLTSVCG